MGEMAEMMLDGTLCGGCGAYIDDDDGDGIPRYCSTQCARDCGAGQLTMTRKERHAANHPARTNCPVCRKRVKVIGLADHMRDSHSQKAA